MPHKVHPKIFRIGTVFSWDSKWFAKRGTFAKWLKQDVLIKDFLTKKLKEAKIDRIEIERRGESVNVIIYAAKPGIIIGRAGAGAENLKKDLKNKFWRGKKLSLNINIYEVKKPALSAHVVVSDMIDDLEKRMPFKRVLKQAASRVMKAGAGGVKLCVSGRLNGAEIARTEKIKEGNVPLQSLRADIDYAYDIARTIYGAIGVKIWIYRGEIFEEKPKNEKTEKQKDN